MMNKRYISVCGAYIKGRGYWKDIYMNAFLNFGNGQVERYWLYIHLGAVTDGVAFYTLVTRLILYSLQFLFTACQYSGKWSCKGPAKKILTDTGVCPFETFALDALYSVTGKTLVNVSSQRYLTLVTFVSTSDFQPNIVEGSNLSDCGSWNRT
ncbi:hypothetical protein Gasu2_03220 [Galdieria sulphuraria]|nr:hypothetical protein Gasu2_03220 [Galdieria sulphuraria]